MQFTRMFSRRPSGASAAVNRTTAALLAASRAEAQLTPRALGRAPQSPRGQATIRSPGPHRCGSD